MAGLMQRDGMWHATWKVGRKSVRKSTGVAVKTQGMTERKARAMAQEQADKMEMAAKGEFPVDKLMDAVRSAAERAGMSGNMPTLREYLGDFPRTATEGSEINRRRAFTVFLEYMGKRPTNGLIWCLWGVRKTLPNMKLPWLNTHATWYS